MNGARTPAPRRLQFCTASWIELICTCVNWPKSAPPNDTYTWWRFCDDNDKTLVPRHIQDAHHIWFTTVQDLTINWRNLHQKIIDLLMQVLSTVKCCDQRLLNVSRVFDPIEKWQKRTPGPLQGDAWVQCCKTLHAVRKDFKPKNTFSLHSDKSMENHTLWSHTKLNNSTQSNTQSNWQQSETGDFTSSLTKPCWQQQHHNPKPCCVSHVHCTPVFQ